MQSQNFSGLPPFWQLFFTHQSDLRAIEGFYLLKSLRPFHILSMISKLDMHVQVLDHKNYHSVINPLHTLNRTLDRFLILRDEFPNLEEKSTQEEEINIRRSVASKLRYTVILDYAMQCLVSGVDFQKVLSLVNNFLNIAYETDSRTTVMLDMVEDLKLRYSCTSPSGTTLSSELNRIQNALFAYPLDNIYYLNEVSARRGDVVVSFSLCGNLSMSNFLDPVIVTNLPTLKYNYYPSGLLNSHHLGAYFERINYLLRIRAKLIVIICRNNVVCNPRKYTNISFQYIGPDHDPHFTKSEQPLTFPGDSVGFWIRGMLANTLYKFGDFTSPVILMNALIKAYNDCTTFLLTEPFFQNFYEHDMKASTFLGKFDCTELRLHENIVRMGSIYIVNDSSYPYVPRDYNFLPSNYHYSIIDVYKAIVDLTRFDLLLLNQQGSLRLLYVRDVIRCFDEVIVPSLAHRPKMITKLHPFLEELAIEATGEDNLGSNPTSKVLYLPHNYMEYFHDAQKLESSITPVTLFTTPKDDNLLPRDIQVIEKEIANSKQTSHEIIEKVQRALQNHSMVSIATQKTYENAIQNRMELDPPTLQSDNNPVIVANGNCTLSHNGNNQHVLSEFIQVQETGKPQADLDTRMELIGKEPSPEPCSTTRTIKKRKIIERLKEAKLGFVSSKDVPVFSDDSDLSDNSFDPIRNFNIKKAGSIQTSPLRKSVNGIRITSGEIREAMNELDENSNSCIAKERQTPTRGTQSIDNRTELQKSTPERTPERTSDSTVLSQQKGPDIDFSNVIFVPRAVPRGSKYSRKFQSDLKFGNLQPQNTTLDRDTRQILRSSSPVVRLSFERSESPEK